jgi:hypothetical protein
VVGSVLGKSCCVVASDRVRSGCRCVEGQAKFDERSLLAGVGRHQKIKIGRASAIDREKWMLFLSDSIDRSIGLSLPFRRGASLPAKERERASESGGSSSIMARTGPEGPSAPLRTDGGCFAGRAWIGAQLDERCVTSTSSVTF